MKKILLAFTLLFCGSNFYFLFWAQESNEQPTPEPQPTLEVSPSPAVLPTPTPATFPSPSPQITESHRPSTRQDPLKLYNNKNYREAVNVCLEDLKKTPNNRELYVIAGSGYLALGYYQEAYDISKKGIEQSGADERLISNATEALFKIAEELNNSGKTTEALAKLKLFFAFTTSQGRLIQAYALMGDIYFKRGSYVYADLAYSCALYYNPQVYEWWLQAGLAREKNADYRGALAAYLEALKLKPESEEAKRGRDRVRQKISS